MVIRLSSEKHNPSFDNDRLDIIHVVIECGAGFVWESKLVKKKLFRFFYNLPESNFKFYLPSIQKNQIKQPTITEIVSCIFLIYLRFYSFVRIHWMIEFIIWFRF